ncbi:MAG: alpha/beta fold hydrolase [Devosia sp.]
MRSTFRRLMAASAAGVLVLASCLTATSQSAFYTADAADIANGTPGSMIRMEKDPVAAFGGTKYRILYRSVGLQGEPIAVSGMAFVPPGEMPAGGWPIVAWGHPTSGLVPKCAPSVAAFGNDQVQGLEELLKAGYVVTATDYPGLGTPGPHPYLVGDSEGHAVLDSIRAAREIIGGASPYAALWGHSQGGQAVLFAADLAATYAPDIKLVGVAAAAPATELAKLLDDDISTNGGKNLLAMTLYSWNEVFNAPIDQVVTPTALKTVYTLAQECIESIIDIPGRLAAGDALAKDFLSVDNVTTLEPWKDLIAANTIGALPTDIPVLLVQGEADDTVDPQVTVDYVSEICAAGSKVSFELLPKVTHLNAAKEGVPYLTAWLADLAAGTAPANNCPQS